MPEPGELTIALRPLPKRGLRLVALLNAGAGTADHKGEERVRDVLTPAFKQLNVAAELRFCTGPELRKLADMALARAKAGEIDAVVVGGGDGSIRTVAG